LDKPIGVSAYQLQKALPEQMKGSLPTIEELEVRGGVWGNRSEA